MHVLLCSAAARWMAASFPQPCVNLRNLFCSLTLSVEHALTVRVRACVRRRSGSHVAVESPWQSRKVVEKERKRRDQYNKTQQRLHLREGGHQVRWLVY